MPIKNCVGNRYGYIEVLEKTSKRKRNYVVYKCKCHKCGKIVEKTDFPFCRHKFFARQC